MFGASGYRLPATPPVRREKAPDGRRRQPPQFSLRKRQPRQMHQVKPGGTSRGGWCGDAEGIAAGPVQPGGAPVCRQVMTTSHRKRRSRGLHRPAVATACRSRARFGRVIVSALTPAGRRTPVGTPRRVFSRADVPCMPPTNITRSSRGQGLSPCRDSLFSSQGTTAPSPLACDNVALPRSSGWRGSATPRNAWCVLPTTHVGRWFPRRQALWLFDLEPVCHAAVTQISPKGRDFRRVHSGVHSCTPACEPSTLAG